ncbi:hypothetical protein [Leucobacter musarum]|uniref:hypothetical protein n=1 Tax=Leucobacter musarum TaxID=1930747 RepID=UPI0006A7E3A5|nr:hypothetical protein [Leucobacter musarum]
MIRALWPALASFGAGLVWFATAAGSPLAVAIPVGALGALHLVWAFAVLRAERVVMPRASIAGGLIGLVAAAFLLLTGPLALVPFLALFIFQWSIAIAAVIEVRRGSAARDGSRGTRRAGVFALALVVQAMLVAAIATPALAASEAGEFAVPHGTFHHGGH